MASNEMARKAVEKANNILRGKYIDFCKNKSVINDYHPELSNKPNPPLNETPCEAEKRPDRIMINKYPGYLQKVWVEKDESFERVAVNIGSLNDFVQNNEHVQVGEFEFSTGAWITIKGWCPKSWINKTLKTFDEEPGYISSHIDGNWWKGYVITAYFFDKVSAERAAEKVGGGYIRKRPLPPCGSGLHATQSYVTADGIRYTYD